MDANEEKKLFFSFFEQYPLITYEKEEKIIRPKELSNTVIYIKSGTSKISTFSSNGDEMTISYLNPESYGNIIFGLAPEENPYYIEAFTQVKAWRVSRNEYVEFAMKHPSIYIDLTTSLLRLIQDLYEQIAWLKLGNAYTKIAAAIFYLAKNLGEKEGTAITIPSRVTHQMIANLTGLTRETVSKQVKKLEENNLITHRDTHLIVNDPTKLRAEIETEYLIS